MSSHMRREELQLTGSAIRCRAPVTREDDATSVQSDESVESDESDESDVA